MAWVNSYCGSETVGSVTVFLASGNLLEVCGITWPSLAYE
jgi:hypothetical protein